MFHLGSEIKENDNVLLWQNGQYKMLRVVANESTNSSFGPLHHNKLIGMRFGSRIRRKDGVLLGVILRPTHHLWTLSLPHMTQIIYSKDISLILAKLSILPGSRVIESGIGSGSLTHALVNAVMESGHIFSYDMVETRCDVVREQLKLTGMDKYITIRHRNVCVDGFMEDREIDSVILDLPTPWLCVSHISRVMKKSGSICIFLPCIEQVQQTVAQLQHFDFIDIHVVESLERTKICKPIEIPHIQFDKCVSKKRRIQQLAESNWNSKKRGTRFQPVEVIDDSSPDSKNRAIETDNPDESESSYANGGEFTYVQVSRTKMIGHSAFLIFATRPYVPSETKIPIVET